MEEIMAQKIDDALSKRKDKRRHMVLEEDPFAPEIMAIPLPKGFKQPLIEAYDGVTDPLEHLRTFIDLMRLYAAPDAVMCRSSPLPLRREARDWIATLAPRSIKMFDELSKSFVAYFLSSKRKRKTAIGLMQMSLSKNPPKSMHDPLKKGDKYVNAEEAEKVTKNLRDGWETEAHKRKAYDEQRHTEKNKSKNERMNKGYAQDRLVKQKREEAKAPTPLNIPHTKLLMEIQHMKELEWPKPMLTSSSKRNQSKYYHFHKDHGHDTEECVQLKEEIEHLLRRGLLAKYVKNDRGKQRLEGLPPPRAGVINIIIGGVAPSDDSNSARKSYAHSAGSALSRKKILVDGGSAANVLTSDAFLGLKILPKKLKMVTTPLQGFEGATMISEGTVELPITLGTYPVTVVIVTNFLVVKTPMAYNAIYG
ncbi:uncharacterized protein LOC111399839 [Olea europaea var. sylvestris]|uniref:uncharacterized protein LOC111399839 n=1 Tax=Olea europaea var. sylvestris TaxID=158386 RepID=UPI000C1D886B|nr:uncharacterized protein LOC111399839 [Olea europaea var. sylvestris]